MGPSMKGRAWCVTIKGHDDEDIERLRNLPCERMVVGREVGDGGYQHLQVYVRFKEPCRFSWWKNQFPTAHVELRKGSEVEAARYCEKEGDVVIDRGVNYDEAIPRMKKEDEALQVIAEIEKGAKFGQIRSRHKSFVFWHRRNVLDYMRDEKWVHEYPDQDPVA